MKKLIKITGIITGIVIVLLFIFYLSIDYLFRLPRPEYDFSHPFLNAELSKKGNKTYLGKNWSRRTKGFTEVYVQGSPFEIGYAITRLTTKHIHAQERMMLKSAGDFITSPVRQRIILASMKILASRIIKHIPEEYQHEIYAGTLAFSNTYPDLGPVYERVIIYHTTHDFGHLLMDTALVEQVMPVGGCCSAMAKGRASKNGDIILGRNFDFDVYDMFDNEKVVYYVKPDKGNAYVSVSWGGMSGVISGVNEKNIAVVVSAAKSKDFALTGIPVSLLIRKVLQYADTMNEVKDIMSTHSVIVSDLYTVLDGNNGTTFYRYKRMHEVMSNMYGNMNPALMAALLRDKKGPGGISIGIGNRNSINAIIAGHGIVYNASKKQLWVSLPPHLCGAFVPVDMRLIMRGAKPARPIKADSFITEKKYIPYQKYLDYIVRAQDYYKKKDIKNSLISVSNAIMNNPDFFKGYEILGDIQYLKGDNEQSVVSYEKSLSLFPHYAQTVKRIKKKLEKAKNKVYNHLGVEK
jgi:tetratricopeptide (TPR) repeat protein